MVLHLRSSAGEFVIGYENFSDVLNLAKAFGWNPTGTEAPKIKIKHPIYEDPNYLEKLENALIEDIFDGKLPESKIIGYEKIHPYKDWNGSYLSNEYQVIQKEDAYFLAIALERAIEYIHNMSTNFDTLIIGWIKKIDYIINLIDFFKSAPIVIA